ncbi:hypothetical protein [Paraflavitalea speifideaquila]|uniref:hypothetical protein n=1 Tax=Paraflavitalea speifideaquila TaxID=3076558 RepID=UPI0028F0F8C4|nr:hypothetical protein [Paraflavitalea speifideiaquila]
METITNVGLIECKTPTGAFNTDSLGNQHGFRLKKVMVQNASPEITRMHYPQSEIVLDKELSWMTQA